jgi:hypothetical protein
MKWPQKERNGLPLAVEKGLYFLVIRHVNRNIMLRFLWHVTVFELPAAFLTGESTI